MFLYRYECPVGHVTEKFFTLEGYRREVDCTTCGKPAVRVLGARIQTYNAGWPIHSDAAALHPDDVPAVEHYLASEKGVHVKHDSEGRPIFNNPKERRKYCLARHFYDRNGGYSDPTPTGGSDG